MSKAIHPGLFIIQIVSAYQILSQGHWLVPYQQFAQPRYSFSSYFPPVRSAYSQGRDAKYSSGSTSHNYVYHTVNVAGRGRTKDSDVASPDTDQDEEAETAPDLVEGDIAVSEDLAATDPRLRLAVDFVRYPAKRWPNNTVPYRISKNYSSSEVIMIESAMRTISFLSCIQFVEWDGRRKDYVHFHPDKKRLGCWSYIGHQGTRQQISLERPSDSHCNCFCSTGRALHEIMHALGFYHEHARADRDKYIKIVNKNVRRGKQKNFNTKGDDKTTRNFDYDYNSIMHYGPYYFSKSKRSRKATIIPLKSGITIGQRDMLSKTDCMKLNSLYDCLEDNEDLARRTQLICGMIGV